MLSYIFDGIFLGLTLTIMLGPIFIALTQTGIEKGVKAGLTVGSGIWTSDFLVILFSYLFISRVHNLVRDQVFTYWMGLIGGLILITFGFAIFFKKEMAIEETNSFTAKNYFGFWLKGFLVNTVNPFTFVFWLGIISTYVFGRQITHMEVSVFIGSIMATIIITDIAKVLLAKAIREKLNPYHLQWISRIAGLAMLIFGLVLLWKTENGW